MFRNSYKQPAQTSARFRRNLVVTLWMIGGIGGLFFWSEQYVWANGGTLVSSGDKGPFNVALVASPTPPIPDIPVHFTLVLTKASSDNPVRDATVIASPNMPGMSMPETGPRRFFQTEGRLNQYDLDLPVSMEGLWQVNIQISSPQLGQTNFDVSLKVEKPSAPWGVIIGILVALPLLAGITWWLLFRNEPGEEEEEEG